MTFDEWQKSPEGQDAISKLHSLQEKTSFKMCWQAAYREALTEAAQAVRDAGGDNEDYHVSAIERLKETP